MKQSFDLEQSIMRCWGIIEDLDALDKMVDEEPLPADRIQSILRGMRELYTYKFNKLFEEFEDFVC